MLGWGRAKNQEQDAGSTAPEARPAPEHAGGRSAPDHGTAPDGSARTLQDLLLAEGKITDVQLQQALRKQAETGRFIGEILIEDKVLDQDSLISFLAKHCRIPHLSLLDYLIDKDIVQLLPQEICLRHRLIPIDKLGKNLTVAMVNPLDSDALEHVRQCCPDLRIKPILCASNHFELVIKRLFASNDSSGQHEVSAASLGLSMPDHGRTKAAPAPVAAPVPEAAVPAPAPVRRIEEPDLLPLQDAAEAIAPEIALPPLDPLPETVFVEESIPDAPEFLEDIPAVTPLPEQEPVAMTAATVLENVFHAPPPVPEAPARMDESTLNATSSSLMKEMATVMMDSMRDTYAVLARRMELFRGVPPEEVAKIFARGITQEYETGDVIFEKGAPASEMFVILGGTVQIRDGGRDLARLDRGGMFGEMALLSSQPRSASAVAADTTSVLTLSNETFRQGMPPHVSIQLLTNIITTLSARLRQANER